LEYGRLGHAIEPPASGRFFSAPEHDADRKGPLFRTIGRTTRQLTRTTLPQSNAHAMIRRRVAGAGIKTGRQSHFPGDRHHAVSEE
jgi:hypothetical protein